MLTKEQFIDFINISENYSNEIDKWVDFGINIFELPISQLGWDLFNSFIDSHFDDDGRDWINWYMFERVSVISKEVLPCFDENGEKFYVNTPEDLWNLVKDKLIDYTDDEDCNTRSDIS